MSSTLLATVKKSPAVLITNHFDPYCLEATSAFEELHLPKDSFLAVFVDDLSPSEGSKLEADSITESKGEILPHLYLHGKYSFGAEHLAKLCKRRIIKHYLSDAQIIPPPNMSSLESLKAAAKFTVIVNSFSPYCFSALDIISFYDLGTDQSILKIVYVDKLPGDEGENLENAALAAAKCANLPVMFINGQSIGSLEELKELHQTCQLEQLFVDAGIFQGPDFQTLEALKKTPLLVMKNSFSAYCLNVMDLIEELKLDGSKVKLFDLENAELVERAARLQTKSKEPPFIFLNGTYVPTAQFINLGKDKKLREYLAQAGI